MNPNSYRTAKY